MSKKIVVALGGNAILPPKQEATLANQLQNVDSFCEKLVGIIAAGYQLVLTHGNGPQVGNILRQNEEGKAFVPPLPLYACCAQSQGLIGHMIEQTLKNQLHRKNLTAEVACLLTHVEVDANDPAFQQPDKPIGMFFSADEAQQLAAERNWQMAEDAGRGYRRVVASPQPQSIHGVKAIKALIEQNTLVIAAGGGGIPVIRTADGLLEGAPAIIDKDRSGFKLAEQLGADVFMMITDVTNVYLNFGQPNQKKLDHVTLADAKRYLNEGHFAAGSMGPKMEAAIAMAEQGNEGIICSLDTAVSALAGQAGTRISAHD